MDLVKLPQSIVSLLSKRLIDEKTAEYFYISAANWCRLMGYEGGEKYFNGEAASEKEHFQKLIDYMADWNVQPILPSIEQPAQDFTDLKDILERAYQMEYSLMLAYQEISATIFTSHLVTFDFLSFYRNIQNESVIEYSTLLNKLALYPESDMVYFDQEVLAA